MRRFRPRRDDGSFDAVDLSRAEADAFAALVRDLVDPEWRRLRFTILASALVLTVASVAALRFLGRWPWNALIWFTVTFIVTLLGGLSIVVPRLVRRRGHK